MESENERLSFKGPAMQILNRVIDMCEIRVMIPRHIGDAKLRMSLNLAKPC